MANRSANRYEYDAALSYAGDDRRIAERLAKHLKSRGMRVFYDRDHLAHLWGKRQGTFEAIFGPKSRFVIPLISQHYVQKDWPRLEFQAARREERNRKGDFILPIRLDDTPILGLCEDQVYLSLEEHSVREIAEMFARRCGKRAAKRPRGNSTAAIQQFSLLSQTTRQALGLLATSHVPARVESFRKLFPEINWRGECSRLAKAGLIDNSRIGMRVPPRVRRFFEGEPDWANFNERWIAVLTPIRDHLERLAVPGASLLPRRPR